MPGTGTVMGVAALVLGALGIGNLQDNKAPAAAEAKAPVASVESAAQADPGMQRRVSGKFENANLAEVLRWLGGQGVSFVADGKELAGDSRLTMNIVNQPLSDVVEAIAGAFNGKWERHGSVYTFKRHGGVLWAPEAGKSFSFEMPEISELKGMDKIGPEVKLHIDGMLKELKAKGLMDGQKIELHGMGKIGPEVKLHMDQMLKELKAKGLMDGQKIELHGMDKIGPEVKLHMDQMLKELKAKGLMDKDGKGFTYVIPDMKGLDKELKELDSIPHLKLNSSNVPKLIESLTAEQKAKHERQGYLTMADLTPAQRSLLGGMPDGANWTISYSIDGKSITIKGK